MYQSTFFTLMAAQDIAYKDNIDVKLEGIAKGVGVEFKKK
jgi:hypothetical protein